MPVLFPPINRLQCVADRRRLGHGRVVLGAERAIPSCWRASRTLRSPHGACRASARSGEAGLPPPYVHLFGFAQTSHHAPNSFVNSTSHSSKGIYLQKPSASMVVGVSVVRQN